MKDNQQLAKKLKDFQDYRNTNLIVENQPYLDLQIIFYIHSHEEFYVFD